MVRYHHRRAPSFSFLMILLSLLWTTSLVSAADLIENIGEGRINWSQGLLTANGIGTPPKEIKNPAQARAMIQRAAITLARRNLLEVLKGVRIDSSTTVENLIVSSDVIRTQVSGILKGSQVLQTKYFSDGSLEVTVGVLVIGELGSALMPPSLFLLNPAPPSLSPQPRTSEKAASGLPPGPKEGTAPGEAATSKAATAVPVTVASAPTGEKEMGKAEASQKGEPVPPALLPEKHEGESAGQKAEVAALPSGGKTAEATAPAAPSPAPLRSEEPKSQTQPAPPTTKPEGEKPAASEEKAGSEAKPLPAPPPVPLIATGLVVDARGLGLKPALLPRILDEGGGEIYSARQVSRQSAVEQGLVGYAKDIAAAQRNIRVTDKPLLVKGIKAIGKEKTDVVIPDSDAATVVAAASASNFLEKSRVIIVYD